MYKISITIFISLTVSKFFNNSFRSHQSNDIVQTANNKSNCDIEPSILKTESIVNNSQSNGRSNADEVSCRFKSF